jgi:hypothetical protein
VVADVVAAATVADEAAAGTAAETDAAVAAATETETGHISLAQLFSIFYFQLIFRFS